MSKTQAPDPAPLSATVAAALRRAFNLGQTYWQQADSDSYSQNAKSDITRGKFNELLEETTAAVDAIPAPEGALPPLPEPHWPRGYQGAVPSGGYTADQMHAYARAALAAPAPQATTQEPAAWLVLDRDGSLIHAAAWREAAHDQINDAISEHGISEAARWVVRPVFIAPQTKEPTNDR